MKTTELYLTKSLRVQANQGVGILPNGHVAFPSALGVQIWNTSRGKCLKVLHDNSRTFNSDCVGLSDGSIATAMDSDIVIWNPKNCFKEPEKILFTDIDRNILNLFIFEDQLLAIFDEKDGKTLIGIWNEVVHSAEGKYLTIDHSEMRSVIVVDKQHIASRTRFNDIKIWNLDTGQCEFMIHATGKELFPLREGRLAWDSHKEIRIYDVCKREIEQTLVVEGHYQLKDVREWDGNKMIVLIRNEGNLKHSIQIWDRRMGQCIISKEVENDVRNIYPLSQNTFLIRHRNAVKIWDLSSQKQGADSACQNQQFFAPLFVPEKFYQKLEDLIRKADDEPFNDAWSYQIYFLIKKHREPFKEQLNHNVKRAVQSYERVLHLFESTHELMSKYGTHSPHEMLRKLNLPLKEERMRESQSYFLHRVA